MKVCKECRWWDRCYAADGCCEKSHVVGDDDDLDFFTVNLDDRACGEFEEKE